MSVDAERIRDRDAGHATRSTGLARRLKESLFALVLTHHVGFVYALALGISLFLLKKEEIKSPAFLILLLILVFEGILIFFQYSTARGATSWIEAPSLSLINGFVIRELSHWPFYLLGLFGFASLFKSKGRVEHLMFASLLTIVFSSLLLIISLTAIPLLVPRHFILLPPCFFLLFFISVYSNEESKS